MNKNQNLSIGLYLVEHLDVFIFIFRFFNKWKRSLFFIQKFQYLRINHLFLTSWLICFVHSLLRGFSSDLYLFSINKKWETKVLLSKIPLPFPGFPSWLFQMFSDIRVFFSSHKFNFSSLIFILIIM
jgi:hypothetical protein